MDDPEYPARKIVIPNGASNPAGNGQSEGHAHPGIG